MNPAPSIDPVFTNLSTYPAETTVQMCYEVEEYNTAGTQNWMHGIVPIFGPGWDLTTLQPVGQPETQFWSGGEWIWVGDITAGITGEFIPGPGWFFDAASGGGTLDGDPTDNWGDGNNGPWTFCWEITTQSCPPAFNEANLIVEILNFADSETGSWNNSSALNQCINDPSFYIQGLQLDCPTCDESGLNVVNPTCQTIDETAGVVIVTPAGIGPWNYIWFNLDSGEIIEENNNVTLPVTVSGLTPASYLIQVEDLGFDGGCSSPVYFEILAPEEIVVEFDVVNASCSDSNDGSILISSIMNSNCIDSVLIAEDINLDGVIDNDDYSCPSTPEEVCGCDFVTYFNACQAENWYGLSDYTFGECSGFPDYDISWSSDNSIDAPTWDGEIINLFSGDYTVSITTQDNTSPVFGCEFETTVTVDAPEEFIYDFTVNNISCFIDEDGDGINDITDGSIDINLTGGTPGYTTFASSLDGTNNLGNQLGSSVIFDNLGVDDYYFTPVDTNGCLLPEQEVFFSILEPAPLSLDSISFSDYNGFGVSCNGGSDGVINIEVVGGTPPYTFEWSNSSISQNLTNAPAGTYSVLISCSNACELLIEDLVLTEPTVVDVTATITSVSCSGASDGAIVIDVDGGFGPYSFEWSGPGGFSSVSSNIFDVPTGEYTILVIDANECEYDFVFDVTTPNPILINPSINNISCFSFDDGSINIDVSGGNPPYTFAWSNDSISQNLDNLEPGTYSIVVTDSEDCFETGSYEIEEPSLLTATVSTSDVACFGENTGLAIANIDGGTPPYTETWNGGVDPDNLLAGTYSVVISDDNNCTVSINNIVINEPSDALVLNAIITDVVPCNGDQTGSISPFATGGTPPYQYSSSSFLNLNALLSDTYTISVEDANGCVLDVDFFVDEPAPINSNINISNVSCFGLSDGQVTSTPTGGESPYSLMWTTPFGESIDTSNLSTGTYWLTIEDGLGCTYTESFFVSEPSQSDMDIVVDGQPSCLESFTVSVVGDLSPGSWSGSGPGGIIFSNPSDFSTSVSVFAYGLYEIVYTNECGEKIALEVSMLALEPDGNAYPALVYCDFETYLDASSASDEGYWTVLDFPENTNVTIDDPNSFGSQVFMTPIDENQECCYGDYVFSFTSCGKSDLVYVTIEKNAPDFGYSNFMDCSLDGEIFIDNPISFVDALIDPGSWEWTMVGNNTGTVDVHYETPHQINFSVSEYGLYAFKYFVCDTFYQHIVGFSCPLELPNTFTPNGDQNNDMFLGNQLIPFIHTQINFTVYNRFGQIVHSQNRYDFQNNLWDGTTNTFEEKKLEDGVYYYTLELFNNASRRKEKYTGYVHLFGNGE